MSIQELAGKFKAFCRNTEYLLAALIVAVSLASFWLGTISGGSAQMQESGAISLTELRAATLPSQQPQASASDTTASTDTPLVPPEGGYVASKHGTKYHLPWCGSARQISEQNKIFFASKEEAEAAGYSPASNCKGI